MPDRLTLTYQLWADELGKGATLEKDLRSLNVGVPYWVAVEAFNETGVSKLSRVVTMSLIIRSQPPVNPARFSPSRIAGTLPHVPPDEIVAVIGCLQQDRSLVDAEIVGGDPAAAAGRPTRFQASGPHI